MKDMDQSATRTASIWGMQEALSLYCNKHVWTTAYFSIGYALFAVSLASHPDQRPAHPLADGGARDCNRVDGRVRDDDTFAWSQHANAYFLLYLEGLKASDGSAALLGLHGQPRPRSAATPSVSSPTFCSTHWMIGKSGDGTSPSAPHFAARRHVSPGCFAPGGRSTLIDVSLLLDRS
ncbi:hypothetical protein LZ32DRAFT_696480 [Colletotrichum eremochloae]|nr:hypothetical protein LZ32DRAFT_696480 [Colletotrichum eremochloae]